MISYNTELVRESIEKSEYLKRRIVDYEEEISLQLQKISLPTDIIDNNGVITLDKLDIEKEKKDVLELMDYFSNRVLAINNYLYQTIDKIYKIDNSFLLNLHDTYVGVDIPTFLGGKSVFDFAKNYDYLECLGEKVMRLKNEEEVPLYAFKDKVTGAVIFVDKYYSSKEAFESIMMSIHKVPKNLLNNAIQIVVLDKYYSEDEALQEFYDDPSFRTAGTAGDADITFVSGTEQYPRQITIYRPLKDTLEKQLSFLTDEKERNSLKANFFAPTIAHEAGHCLDDKLDQFTIDGVHEKSEWTIAMEKDDLFNNGQTFTSEYAKNAYTREISYGRNKEDFADSFDFIHRHGMKAFESKFPNRAAIIKRLVPEYENWEGYYNEL